MTIDKKKKREFDRGLDYNGYSWQDEKNYKELKEDVFWEKFVLDENPIGTVSLSFDSLPEEQSDFEKLVKGLKGKDEDDSSISTHWWQKKRYSKFFNSMSSDSDLVSVFDFYRYSNKAIWKYVKDNPEHQFPLYEVSHHFIFISFFGKGLALPDTVVTSIHYNNELLAIETADSHSETETLPVVKNVQQQELVKQEIKDLEHSAFDIDNFYTPELNALYDEAEEMKRELQVKLDQMYALQSQLKAEIEQKIAKAKKEVFLLETDFYALLSRWGETVSFDRITKGEKAPIEKPLVIQQKTVYLAEDLPRLKHFYNAEATTFDELLQTSPEFVEHVSPNDKSVTFFKYQRKEGKYVSDDTAILKFVADLFPSSVGILVRDGENMYMGWADGMKVQVGEDSFASNSSQEEALKSFDDIIKNRRTVSRYFIINILIGLISSHKSLIDLPVAIDTPEQLLNSQYVVFSNADNQIATNYYPSLEEYRNYVNPYTALNDNIYVLWKLRDGTERNWNNQPIYTRGKGDRNLTEDAYVSAGFHTVKDITYGNHSFYVDGGNGGAKRIYVGAKKINLWADDDFAPKIMPSFEVYPDEFVNTTFLTAEMVEEWLSNKNIGSIRSETSEIGFDYMVKVLLNLQKVVKKQQAEEQELIPSVAYNSDLVASFKVIKGVKHFTPYQAKRYVKWVKSLSVEEKEKYQQYRYVLENISTELNNSLRSRFIVGYKHPTEPIFYGACHEVKTEDVSWHNPKGNKIEELFYTEFVRPINERDLKSITTFGQYSRAKKFADRLNNIPFNKYESGQDDSKDNKELKSLTYSDSVFLAEKPTWEVYDFNDLAKIRKDCYAIRDKVQKEDPEHYKLWG